MSVKDDLKRKYGGGTGAKLPTATSAATAAATGRTEQKASGPSPVRQDAQPRKNYSIKSSSTAASLREKYGSDTSAESVRRYQERVKRTAQAGLEKFEADRAQREAGRQAASAGMGLTRDSLALNAGGAAADAWELGRSYVEDTSWREPSDKWQADWLDEFGLRYNADPEDAYSYAQQINDYLKAQELGEQEKGLAEWSKEHPVLSTGASLLTSPLGTADLIEKGLEYAARGTVTQRGNITPGTFSGTATSGLAQKFNEKGTISEKVPIIGGKGLGDLYSLGTSSLQSILLGNTIGEAGTLASYFGQAGSSGFEEIKARGGSDEQAILYGLASGAAEVLTEKLSLDNLLKGGDAMHYTLKDWTLNVLKQAGVEGSEELASSFANEMADRWIMGDKSNFNTNVQRYMAQDMSQEDAKKQAWLKYAEDAAFDFIGGMASGGFSMSLQTGPTTIYSNHQTRKAYTPDMEAGLLELAAETDEDSDVYRMGQKYSGRGKPMTGGQINQLAGAYEQYTDQQDADAYTEDARSRLEALGEENELVAAAIGKTLTEQELSKKEQKALNASAAGQEVLRTMQQEMEPSGTTATFGGSVQSPRSNPMVNYYEDELRSRETSGPAAATENAEQTVDPLERAALEMQEQTEPVSPDLTGTQEADTAPAAIETAQETEAAAEESSVAPEANVGESEPPAPVENAVDEVESAAPARTIGEAAQDFGDQAKKVEELYQQGQDVEEFTSGVRAAWEMGHSGLGIDRAVSSTRTQGISENQRRQAYLLGQGASRMEAQGKAGRNAKAATGGTVRRKGVVKGQGVSIDDLAKTFNDPQRTAYKLLSFYAEVTGVDVVLYKGTQEQETGRFAHGENTIYIDITAGTNGWDATDLGAYTMMRTFSHEFVHFVEKWSPVEYDNLRGAVFAQMEKNGQDTEALVELAVQEQGLDFDQATREVVAESLTDILPESQFVQTLARENKGLFEKMKERLEQFVADLKEHWKKLTGNNSREARALKTQVGEALKYADEVVRLFDMAAMDAVDAYQMTVAGFEEVRASEVVEETATETVEHEPEETTAEPEAASQPEASEDPAPQPPEALQKYLKKFGKKHQTILLTVGEKGNVMEIAGSPYLLFRLGPRQQFWEGFRNASTRHQTWEQFNDFADAHKPLTEQPMIGSLDKLKVAEFDTPDGKIFFNWDLLRYLDGNALCYKKISRGAVIRANDPNTGELVGLVMGMKMDGKNIQDKKPGKMKSFGKDASKAKEHTAQKQEAPAETVREPQTISDDRFTIESTKGGTVYVTFPGKPSTDVRNALKWLDFKWSSKKKAWYGKGDPAEVADAVRGAFDAASRRVDQMLGQAEEIAREWDKAHGITSEEPDFEKDPYGWAEYQLSDDMRYGPIDLGGYEATIQPVNYDDRLFFYRGTLREYKSKNPVEVGEEVYRTNLSEKREDVVNDMVRTLKKLGAYGKDAPKAEESAPAATAPETEMEGGTPSEKLANAILSEYLSKDRVIDPMKLYALADKAFGGTQGEGAYNRKDAYDAMELAVNKYLLTFAKDMNGDTLKAQQSVRKLEELLRFLPTQSVRTQEQQDFQQFSTPPNIAYLAAWAGNVQAGEQVLEPSAGIGGIAVFAKSWGADVAVNELSERRLGILKSMGFDRVFNENAEQLDNVLPGDVQPSLVLMNPPFSSTAGRTTHNKTSNAERHIDQALARLRDGGRLVAILGKGMNDADYRKYWDKLRQEYSIRANLSIDGDNYKKYGTNWGVQLVVIDKTGPQAGQTVTGSFKDLTEVPAVLEGIRNDRRAVEDAGTERGNDPGSQSVADRGAGESHGSTGAAERSDRKPARDPGAKRGSSTGRSKQTGTGTERTGVRNAGEDQRAGIEGGADRAGGSADPGTDVRPAVAGGAAGSESQRAPDVTQEREDDGVYATFVLPEVPVPGGKKHPATLVESAAMAAVPMPKATYKPSLPENVVKNNLSDAQMVTVTYAGQAHSQKLPDGSRKGFFIGDGTGVGKGRQIAGIILDNVMQGRTKAVWVSKNGDLYNDAVRDWTATTGRSKDEVINHTKIKAGGDIAAESGILFTTYPTLRSAKDTYSRLDQIVKWLGEDFDGVIAFDEAHNMGNLYGKKGKFGKAKGSDMAKAGVELQRRLPNARVVYVSATAATEVDNLAYAERLGLWGKGTAFNDAKDFISKIGSSGLAAMELVVRDMKAMGVYVARSISYQGVVYDTIEHTLDENQTYIYNAMSFAWQSVMSNVNAALALTGGQNNSQARQRAMGQFYSSMQRFYNQALTSMSMPSVIEDMRRELAAGRSCVLQIVNTNEAQQNKKLAQAKADGTELDDLDLTPREALIGYLETCFPTQEFEEYVDEDGNLRSRPVLDSKGQPVHSRKAMQMRDSLIESVNQMAIPDGPLEMLFDAFGTENVAENTGRSRRVVPKRQADGTMSRVEERRTLNSRTADVQAFQDGKKRILVFSDAGGTGKSYHADRSEKNQQQRIHYVLQPGWSASNAVQGFGRTHRSNEASAPIYKLVTTNIKGQKRFTSTIARRLDQLGALTKGQRDTGSGMFGAKDNLETDLARDSLREFYKRLGADKIEGVDGMKTLERLGLKHKFTDEYGSFKMDENTARDMSTFLNRILALEVDEQNRVFDTFTGIYEMNLEAAIQAGTLDTGMENVKADKIEVLDDQVIREDGNNGAATHYVQAKTYRKPKVLTTISQVKKARDGFVGIYETDNGTVRAVYRMADKTTEWGAIVKQYRLIGPNLGAKTAVWQEGTLNARAKLLEEGQWQSAWDKEVKQVPEYNEETLHMLTGALLPIWDNLPQESSTKVKRLIAADGRTYLGREVQQKDVDMVLRQFQTSRTMEQFTAKDVMKKGLENGTRFRLTKERAEIFRSRVSGEWRLEIKQLNAWQLRRYNGIIHERINFQDRFFIPKSEAGEAILKAILEANPIRETSQEDQMQVRRIALTDRQVLEMAADKIDTAKLDKAGRDAFRIFQERLGRLRTLQEDRAELGTKYKEQQFGKPADRAGAAETLEKMHRLDADIAKAADDVLVVEQGSALRKVLQQARKVVEADQKQYDEALLKEYRNRRNESAAQRKYRRAVQAQVKELQDFILAPDTKRMKLCPEFLRQPVLALLETIDQSSKRKLNGGEPTKADRMYSDCMNSLSRLLRNNAGRDENGNADLYEGFLDLPEDFIAKVDSLAEQAQEIAKRGTGQNVVNTMTAAQLKELADVLTSMKTLIQNANKFHTNAMFQYVSQAGMDTIAYTGKHKDWSKARGGLSVLGNVENWIFWKNVRPALIFQRFGKVGESILRELEQGQDQLARSVDEVVAFAEKTYTEKEIREWEEKRKTIRFADGSRCRLTVAQIMGLYCMAKRDQAIRHLTQGGFVVQGENGGIVKVHMGLDDLGVFGNALTNRQRAVADKLQHYMSEQGGAWGNAVTMRRFGIRVYGEDFYYPLATYDEKRSASIDKPEGSDLHALLNMSFTKELTKDANNAVMVYSIFDVFADHMGSMAQYNAMALPVLDAVKWLNYSETISDEETGFQDVLGVKTELRRVYGTPPSKKGNVKVRKGYAEQFILNLLRSYNSTSPQATPNDKLGLGMLHRYNRSQVAFNVSVAVKQPLAIFRAMQVIDPGSITKGMVNIPALKQGMDEMLKYSGIAIWKGLGFYDVNVSKGMGKLIRHDNTILDKVTDIGMAGAEWADKLTWAAIWNACRSKCGGNMQKTAELFEKVIYETQVVDSVLTKTEYMRDQGTIARTFSSFMGESAAAISPILNDAYMMDLETHRKGGNFQTAWKKYGAHFGRSVAVYSVTAIITAAVAAVISAWRDDDDYQSFAEKWQEAVKGAIGDELNPFTKLPLVGDIAEGSYALYQAAVKGEDPWLALSSMPMGEIVQYAVDGGKILNDLITGEDTNYTWYGAVRKLLQAASGATGIPAATASREVVDLWNNTVGHMAPSLKVKTYELKPATELKYAYLDGYVDEEEATAKLLELGDAEDENDAYWTIRKWEGGEDWSRYDALAETMANGEDISGAMDELTTHGIDEKDARSQIRSIVGDWLEKGAITETEARNLLTRYGDLDADEAESRVDKWNAQAETGYSGTSDAEDAYLSGELSAQGLTQVYTAFGLDTEEAAEKLDYLTFRRDNPAYAELTNSGIDGYREYCEGAGIGLKDYYAYRKWFDAAESDKDENGNTITNSKRDKVREYVDSLNLTAQQKDALYMSFGYKESTLYQTPWH